MTDKTKKQKPWYIEYDLIILDIISILLLGYTFMFKFLSRCKGLQQLF